MNREQTVAFAFFLFGLGILIYLCTLLSIYPLFDWAIHDINWTQAWLYMTILDYYGVAVCLAVITLYSETLLLACIWSLGFFLLGSPVCTIYMCYRLLIHGTVSLESNINKKSGDKFAFRTLDE